MDREEKIKIAKKHLALIREVHQRSVRLIRVREVFYSTFNFSPDVLQFKYGEAYAVATFTEEYIPEIRKLAQMFKANIPDNITACVSFIVKETHKDECDWSIDIMGIYKVLKHKGQNYEVKIIIHPPSYEII